MLKLQHIATKNALLNVLKGKFDYDEKILISDVIHQLEDVRFDKAVSKDAADKLAAKDAALEAAKAALMVSMWELEFNGDDDLISAHCAGCYVERGDLESGVDRHSEGCVIAEALAALAASRGQG